MTFLPIVTRELRVAARKRSTFRLRVVAMVVAVLLGMGFLIILGLSHTPGGTMGRYLFSVLTGLAFAAALCSGLFLTSDCLSEERREGTLGLLFLTDLRGYDIILGKLLATSLRSVYALLAIFPVLAVALILGGVTGAQFWKTTLALVNTLFYSLALGMLVSAFSRESQRAVSGVFWLMLLILAGAPLADALLAHGLRQRSLLCCNLWSPLYVFAEAGAWGKSSYWIGLPCNMLASAVFLTLASIRVRHAWQDKANRAAVTTRSWSFALRYGTVRYRLNLRRRLLELDPMVWLACREQWQLRWVWLGVLFTLGFLVAIWVLDSSWLTTVWNALSFFLSLLLYLGAATQSSRFFVEARRSGLVELLLATPLDSKQIARGQWRGILRQFALPLCLVVLCQAAGTVLFQHRFARGAGAPAGLSALQWELGIGTAICTTVGTLASVAALTWYGMWAGMTCKSSNVAALKSLCFVQVIPWFVIAFASMFLGFAIQAALGSMRSGPSTAWILSFMDLYAVISAVLSIAKDLLFIHWSRRRLYHGFRQQASLGTLRAELVPPLLPPAAPPPLPAPQV